MTETTAQQHNLALSHHTKGKEQARVTLENTSGKKKENREKSGKKMSERKSWAEKTHDLGLNMPMNHMIDVASYWACACQKTADLRQFRGS